MMNRGGWFGSAAVLLAALSLAGCGASQADASAEQAPSDSTPVRVVNVEVQSVEAQGFVESITVTGEVQADRDVMVAAEESGVVREVFVDKGARVAANQALARIDDRLLRAQFDQARAEAALARETWERQRRLWELDSIGTELAYLRAKYGAETAEANARALETRLERTVVRAPIGGTIDARFIEVGSTLQPGAAVVRIVDADPVKVMAGIPERYAGEVRAGGNASVTFDHLDGREFQGRLAFVGTAVNAANRTFPIEVTLPNPGGTLKPGMVARVRTPRRSVNAAMLVPRDAVLRSATGYLVYVVRTNGDRTVAEARAVTTGASGGGKIVITEGLEPGDRVVVVGQQQLSDGDFVQIVQGGGQR
jgi:membrane fusion protein (multidrug efflux system)